MHENDARFRLAGSRTQGVRRNVPLSRNELARQLMTLAAQLPNLPRPGEWRVLRLDATDTRAGSVIMRMGVHRTEGEPTAPATMEIGDADGEPIGRIGDEDAKGVPPTGRQRGLALCRIFARTERGDGNATADEPERRRVERIRDLADRLDRLSDDLHTRAEAGNARADDGAITAMDGAVATLEDLTGRG